MSVVEPTLALLALTGLTQALEPLGLTLNHSKTAVWSPAGRGAFLSELTGPGRDENLWWHKIA